MAPENAWEKLLKPFDLDQLRSSLNPLTPRRLRKLLDLPSIPPSPCKSSTGWSPPRRASPTPPTYTSPSSRSSATPGSSPPQSTSSAAPGSTASSSESPCSSSS
uniref:Uncharacterized protein n=1 Tax=Ananas comosus var. bracteatus TaxID=296719 RepID=A0A6V7Q494_ANACO|nr:unnamed protein product [Ananas comosus var. bracteatus]